MKKYTKIATLIISAGLMFQSCGDFLDLSPKTGIDDKVAIKDLSSATSAVTGIYDALQHQYYYGRDFIINGDIPADNYILSPNNSNRFVSESRWLITKSYSNVSYFWNQTYDAINRANNVINAELELLPSEKKQANQLIGEAYTLRALVHFDLVRTYAQNYNFTADHTHLGIPYVKVSDNLARPHRDNVKTVYEEIIKDLNEAESLVDSSRYRSYTINPMAVKALKSRVYLYMSDYDNAVKYAELVLAETEKYKLVTNANYMESWTAEYTTESIFTISNTLIDYRQTNSLGYILTSKGYGDILANPDFVKMYDAEKDVRAGWFIQEKPKEKDQLFVSGKYPGRGTIGVDNFNVIRLSEIYLIAAEAHLKATVKDETKARAYVNAIRQRAIKSAPSITASGDALLDEILLEKRKELAFEGHYFHDLKRLQRDVLAGSTGKTITYPNNMFAWPIPESETNANPNIAGQQNPGY